MCISSASANDSILANELESFLGNSRDERVIIKGKAVSGKKLVTHSETERYKLKRAGFLHRGYIEKCSDVFSPCE